MKRITKYGVQLVKESSKCYELEGKCGDSSTKMGEILHALCPVATWHNEKFGMVALDAQNNVIGFHIISEGTIGETNIYVREVATRALLNNANSVVMFHNHPAGSLKPSTCDIEATKRVEAGLKTLQIKLLDHVILVDEGNGKQYTSFAEKGLM